MEKVDPLENIAVSMRTALWFVTHGWTPSDTADWLADIITELEHYQRSMGVPMKEVTAVFVEENNGYTAFAKELPGANTQGDTLEEARQNLLEAVELIEEGSHRNCRDEINELTLLAQSLNRELDAQPDLRSELDTIRGMMSDLEDHLKNIQELAVFSSHHPTCFGDAPNSECDCLRGDILEALPGPYRIGRNETCQHKESANVPGKPGLVYTVRVMPCGNKMPCRTHYRAYQSSGKVERT